MDDDDLTYDRRFTRIQFKRAVVRFEEEQKLLLEGGVPRRAKAPRVDDPEVSDFYSSLVGVEGKNAMAATGPCEDCGGDRGTEGHEESIAHIMALRRKGAPPPRKTQVAYALQEGNIGRRIAEEMGWEAGEGLGPEGQGMKIPLRTRLWKKRRGLGEDTLKACPAKVTHTAEEIAEASSRKTADDHRTLEQISLQRRKEELRRAKATETRVRQEIYFDPMADSTDAYGPLGPPKPVSDDDEDEVAPLADLVASHGALLASILSGSVQ
eukprot:Sspe_Gene.104801::Locus_81846_Transcript_1_1_Confidence_1.000_Length_901::g.104801::m.104801